MDCTVILLGLNENNRVALFDWHERNADKISEFAGWDMPIRYEGVKKEHLAVRNDVGIFDISHMGEIYFKGDDALDFLQFVTSNDVSKPPAISATYTLVINERGGIKDETLIYNMGDGYMMVCDAVAYDKLLSWFKTIKRSVEKLSGTELDLEIVNKTYDMNLFSVQGPKVHKLAEDAFDVDLSDLWWFQGSEMEYDDVNFVLSHSGYTGEDGFEVFLEDSNPYNPIEKKRGDPDKAQLIWNLLLEEGEKYDIKPCGLGARDSTRIEAGYTLYGHETVEKQLLSTKVDQVTPFQVGMGDFVDFDKDFVGKASLEMQKDNVPTEIVHIEMLDRGIPREGYDILLDGEVVGKFTSGTMSPLLNKGIGIGFIEKGSANVGDEVMVDIRGREKKGVIVDPPFYDSDEYGV